MPSTRRVERALWLVLVALLSVQLLVVAERRSRPRPVDGGALAAPVGASELGPVGPSDTPADAADPGPIAGTADLGGLRAAIPGTTVGGGARRTAQHRPSAAGTTAVGGPAGSDDATSPGTAAASARTPRDADQVVFERAFPDQAAAAQDPADPATTRWAVVIGINEHQGHTRDNVASRQDAEELRGHLLELGWRDDHILLLTDHQASGETIQQGLRWLARKTDEHSTSVVHYSGHTKQWPHDVDGDGEVVDEGLWPSDNRFVTDRTFVSLLDGVRGRLWVDLAACEAEGLGDPGLARAGRILTFSSREDQKSYEDPSVDNSVWGFFLIDEALRAGFGDADGDGDVTVQEAFAFAAPRAAERTSRQPHGPQNPVLVDLLDGPFSLRIPSSSAPADDAPPAPDGCRLPVCLGDDG